MNPIFFISLFAVVPLAIAAVEDWKTGMVKNLYAMLITLGAIGVFVVSPELFWANFNLAGIIVWVIVLALAKYNEKKQGIKLLGLADIYLGVALTLLLGMWVNFLWFAMSVALFVNLLTKIFKNPEELKGILGKRTRLVPFYFLGLIGLVLVLFFS